MRKNVMQIIAENRSKIDKRYTMKADDVGAIAKNSENIFLAIMNSFHFGYARGFKAAKKEIANKNHK